MIRYHMIRWRNLLATGNNWITLRLDRDDMTLIVGKNGHGKSQLLDALCFALYGKAFRDVNKPQLVNTVNKKDTVVEIAFTAGVHQYVIRRGIKPNIFEIYKDKVLIPEDASTGDYQEFLEKNILGASFKTFCQVNILGSASFTSFMKLKPADRRAVVEDLLDSRIFSVMQTLAKAEATENNRKIKDLDTDTRVLREKISAEQRVINHQQQDNSEPLRVLNEDIQTDEKRVVELTEQVKVAEEELNAAQSAYEAMNPTKVSSAASDLTTKRAVLDSEVSANNQRAGKIASMDECFTCKQTVGADHKEHIKSQVDQLNATLLQQIAVVDKRTDMVAELIDGIRKQHVHVNSLMNHHRQLCMELTTSKQSVERLKARREQLSAEVKVIDTTEFDRLTEELKQATVLYDDCAKQQGILKQCVSHLGDDGIKTQIINKYIPLMNAKINYYLEKMDLFAQFELDEQFNETIKARFRDTFTFASFSEGEKLRITLALLLAWRHIASIRNSVSSNLLIMDEILDTSLDDEGVADFLGIIRSVVDAPNTFIISHKAVVVEGFENVIKVEKVGHFSEYKGL